MHTTNIAIVLSQYCVTLCLTSVNDNQWRLLYESLATDTAFALVITNIRKHHYSGTQA